MKNSFYLKMNHINGSVNTLSARVDPQRRCSTSETLQYLEAEIGGLGQVDVLPHIAAAYLHRAARSVITDGVADRAEVCRCQALGASQQAGQGHQPLEAGLRHVVERRCVRPVLGRV